jgi:hypothetical protein
MTPSHLLLKAVRESRADIAQEYTALCSELDVQKKIKRSFKQHPFLWLGGAAGAGLLTTLFGGRSSSPAPSPSSAKAGAPTPSAVTNANAEKALATAGWMAGALEIGKLLYPVLRPIVLEFAQKALQSTLVKRK